MSGANGGVSAVGALLLTASVALANDNNGTPMTAGVVLKEMPVRERTTYVMGAIDALAYARFRKDTEASGENDMSGMTCIRDWFHSDIVARMGRVDAAFQKYQDLPPSMVLTAMIEKECGR